jgi:hypothetical protein
MVGVVYALALVIIALVCVRMKKSRRHSGEE